MDRDRLLQLRRAGWLGRTLECHATLESTNDRARALLEERGRAAHGSAVFADEQTGGRGRLGRSWHSPRGTGIALSVALWPDAPAETLACLPLAGSLSVAEALLSVAGLEARLKWPNDVLVGGRKIAGVLVESKFHGERFAGLVLGIGVNLLHREEDFPDELRPLATSALLASGSPPVPEVFAAALLDTLESELAAGLGSPGLWVRRAAHRWVHRPGDALEVSTGGGLLRGRFSGVSGDGALLLEVDGMPRAVHHGDVVRVRPADGG
jgi:BirA family transcriptional regulator, biotin operon repressor / biotin---[acetyl-CoA-carboxylase] ligase